MSLPLQSYGCQAKTEFGFVGGFMTWMYANSKRWESANWASALRSLCSGDVAPSCDGYIDSCKNPFFNHVNLFNQNLALLLKLKK